MATDQAALDVVEGARNFAQTLSGSAYAVDLAVAQAIFQLSELAERLIDGDSTSQQTLRGRVALLEVQNKAQEKYIEALENIPVSSEKLHEDTEKLLSQLVDSPSELGASVFSTMTSQDNKIQAQVAIITDQKKLVSKLAFEIASLQGQIWQATVALNSGDVPLAKHYLYGPQA